MRNRWDMTKRRKHGGISILSNLKYPTKGYTDLRQISLTEWDMAIQFRRDQPIDTQFMGVSQNRRPRIIPIWYEIYMVISHFIFWFPNLPKTPPVHQQMIQDPGAATDSAVVFGLWLLGLESYEFVGTVQRGNYRPCIAYKLVIKRISLLFILWFL